MTDGSEAAFEYSRNTWYFNSLHKNKDLLHNKLVNIKCFTVAFLRRGFAGVFISAYKIIRAAYFSFTNNFVDFIEIVLAHVILS